MYFNVKKKHTFHESPISISIGSPKFATSELSIKIEQFAFCVYRTGESPFIGFAFLYLYQLPWQLRSNWRTVHTVHSTFSLSIRVYKILLRVHLAIIIEALYSCTRNCTLFPPPSYSNIITPQLLSSIAFSCVTSRIYI